MIDALGAAHWPDSAYFSHALNFFNCRYSDTRFAYLAEIDISKELPMWRKWDSASSPSACPSARSSHSMASPSRDKVYLYGGSLSTSIEQVLSSELWELTPPLLDTDEPVWRDLSQLENAPSQARWGHSLIAAGSTLFLLGGDFGLATPQDLVYTIDTFSQPDPVWGSHACTPGALAAYHAAGAVDNVLFMYGGSVRDGSVKNALSVADVSGCFCHHPVYCWDMRLTVQSEHTREIYMIFFLECHVWLQTHHISLSLKTAITAP
jgi:hypothetical protein